MTQMIAVFNNDGDLLAVAPLPQDEATRELKFDLLTSNGFVFDIVAVENVDTIIFG